MGGLTGLVRGCVAGPREIGLSLERMHRMESVDPVNRTITLEAGVPLQVVQQQAERHGVERCVYEPLAARGGPVSAEHGIGLEKQPGLALSRSPAELDLMCRLKAALDPKNVLNPGRVLPP
jgi:FAD/FMN-containing dehydrogenase